MTLRGEPVGEQSDHIYHPQDPPDSVAVVEIVLVRVEEDVGVHHHGVGRPLQVGNDCPEAEVRCSLNYCNDPDL